MKSGVQILHNFLARNCWDKRRSLKLLVINLFLKVYTISVFLPLSSVFAFAVSTKVYVSLCFRGFCSILSWSSHFRIHQGVVHNLFSKYDNWRLVNNKSCWYSQPLRNNVLLAVKFSSFQQIFYLLLQLQTAIIMKSRECVCFYVIVWEVCSLQIAWDYLMASNYCN